MSQLYQLFLCQISVKISFLFYFVISLHQVSVATDDWVRYFLRAGDGDLMTCTQSLAAWIT